MGTHRQAPLLNQRPLIFEVSVILSEGATGPSQAHRARDLAAIFFTEREHMLLVGPGLQGEHAVCPVEAPGQPAVVVEAVREQGGHSVEMECTTAHTAIFLGHGCAIVIVRYQQLYDRIDYSWRQTVAEEGGHICHDSVVVRNPLHVIAGRRAQVPSAVLEELPNRHKPQDRLQGIHHYACVQHLGLRHADQPHGVAAARGAVDFIRQSWIQQGAAEVGVSLTERCLQKCRHIALNQAYDAHKYDKIDEEHECGLRSSAGHFHRSEVQVDTGQGVEQEDYGVQYDGEVDAHSPLQVHHRGLELVQQVDVGKGNLHVAPDHHRVEEHLGVGYYGIHSYHCDHHSDLQQHPAEYLPGAVARNHWRSVGISVQELDLLDQQLVLVPRLPDKAVAPEGDGVHAPIQDVYSSDHHCQRQCDCRGNEVDHGV